MSSAPAWPAPPPSPSRCPPAPPAAARRRLARTATFPSGVVERPAHRARHHALDPGRRPRAAQPARSSRSRATRASARVVRRREVLATPEQGYAAKTRVAGKGLKPGEEYFYRFATADTLEPRRPLPHGAARRLAGAAEDRLLLLPALHRGLLHRAPRPRAGGLRRHRLPRRLHVRDQRRGRPRGRDVGGRERRVRAGRASTARSTGCTAATPTCRRCTRRRRSSSRGTTTRSRTTTPATRPGTTAERRISYEERRRNALRRCGSSRCRPSASRRDADRILPPRPARRARRDLRARPAPVPRRPGVRRHGRRSRARRATTPAAR